MFIEFLFNYLLLFQEENNLKITIQYNSILNQVGKTVYDCKRRSNNPFNGTINNIAALEKFYNEIDINNNDCKIINTTRCVSYCARPRKFFVLMSPLCQNRFMYKLYDIDEFKRCLGHILAAVFSMHNNNFAHNDIRWPNIVFDNSTNKYLLIDFERVTMGDDISNATLMPKKETKRLASWKMNDIRDIQDLINCDDYDQISELRDSYSYMPFFDQINKEIEQMKTNKQYNAFFKKYSFNST